MNTRRLAAPAVLGVLLTIFMTSPAAAHEQTIYRGKNTGGVNAVHGSVFACDNESDDRGVRTEVAIQPGVAAGGSQAPLVNSWVRTSKLSRPHLVAVDR